MQGLMQGEVSQLLLSCTEDQTGSSVLEITAAPGSGCKFHFHSLFVKTLVPVEGTLAYQAKGYDLKLLRPGDSISIAPGTVHRYFNSGTGQIRYRIIIEPGNLSYERGWQWMNEMALDGKLNKRAQPRSLSKRMKIRVLQDVHWGGWKRSLNLVMRFF
jgi:quercetin dioxygenase-like cupin family protein